VVWITGAASGQGAEHARRFAAEGARVGCIDIAQERLDQLVAEISAGGERVVGCQADVSDWSAMSMAGDELAARLGPAQIVVANAWRPQERLAPTDELAPDDWRRVLEVCLTGAFLTAKAAIPQMRSAGGGSITFISSTAGVCGFAGWAAYVAAKHGLLGLMKTVANEYAHDGIRANAICPGTVDTPALDWEAQASGVDRDTLVRDEARQHLIERVIAPAEISDAVLWLSSAAAAMVTGVTMPVDGGFLAKRTLV
jgi:(+)-trans-carveol dehydrogenase